MADFLSKNLWSIRRKWGYSQRQFGEIFGLSPGQIGHYEKERSVPSLETVNTISKITGIPVETLKERELSTADIAEIGTPESPKIHRITVNEPQSNYGENSDLNHLPTLIMEVGRLREEVRRLNERCDKLES